MRNVKVTALNKRRRTPSLRTAKWGLIVFPVLALLFAPGITQGILATNQGATAVRITSTQNLTPAELIVYELQGEFRGFLGTPIDELKGWSAAGGDGQISWGRNVVSGTLGPDQIFARFESNGLPEEAGLSTGDSGGAWFVQDAQGLTRLAGISYAVTGPFQFDVSGSPDGSPFEAALFDIGGLWVGNLGNEVFIPENPVNVPGVGIATRISDALPWIGTIILISPVDTDGDGVVNNFDNCPFEANPGQEDAGGLGFSNTPDGIGDACQCGDVTGEGQVNDTDAAFIKREALGLIAPLFLVPDHCDVTGDGQCNGTDATLIRHAAIGTISPFFGQNCPSALP